MCKIFKPIRAALYVCALLMFSVVPMTASAQDQSGSSKSTAPDNSRRNKAQGTTADQQKENPADRDIARKIRQSVTADKTLSTYAHNVKIIAENGVVTLKGPVRSAQEKQSVVIKAAEVVGKANVTDELTIKE
jgi:hyperosmotically inducible periplasmic protein